MTRPDYPGLLLDDRHSPITTSIGFISAGAREVADSFVAWMHKSDSASIYCVRLAERAVAGSIESGLHALLPLSAPWRRFLFAPCEGGWTAMFGNAFAPNLSSETWGLAGRSRTRGVHLYADPDRVDGLKRATVSHGGGFIVDVFGPEVDLDPELPPEPDGSQPASARHVRGLALLRETEHWRYQQFGEPLPFEDPAWFSARGQKAKLTLDTVRAFLLGLGIRAFDADFYAPNREMILLENQVPWPGGDQTRTLEEAQAAMLT